MPQRRHHSRWQVATVMLLSGGLACSAAVPAHAGDQVRDRQWWITPMGIDRGLSVSRGAGVTVCLIDSGVDATHPDLVGVRFTGGKDLSGKGSSDGLKPVAGEYDFDHGTSMAANIAGRGHRPGDEAGIIGAAPDATITSVSYGVNASSVEDPIATGIRYCTDHGAKVINLSLGTNSQKAQSEVLRSQKKDVVIVSAAGNNGSDPVLGVSGMFGVLSVAGLDQNLTRDPRSNWGRPQINVKKHVSSPGVAVCGPFATTPDTGVPQAWPGGGYRDGAGTSISTSVVTGIVAAIRAKHPNLNAASVINRVLKTAKKTGTGDIPTADCGWGLVDAYAALTADVPAVTDNPLGQIGEGYDNPSRDVFGVKSMGLWDPTYQPDPEYSSAMPQPPTNTPQGPITAAAPRSP
ncbi:S8 family serine peptidase, partial [Austwickia sp. TVS 96-490-7B]|uniref:S8 family peptidase n=1 Tax=Austwickia sp. TVS 96-490-7B TaxID=2830843 RepID=UPI001C57FC3A